MRPLNHLTWSITDYRVRISSNLEKGLMLSKAKSKAWQLLIEDSNRPAERFAWLPDFGSM